MNHRKQPRNTDVAGLHRSLSLSVIIGLALLAIVNIVKFANRVGETVPQIDYSLAWGYLAAGLAPLVVGVFVLLSSSKLESRNVLLRSAFYLGLYYWAQLLFAVSLPFIVDVQASLFYYLVPYVLGLVTGICVYVLAKGQVYIRSRALSAFLTVTVIAVAVTLIAPLL